MKTFICMLSLVCLAAAIPMSADNWTADQIEMLADLSENLQRYKQRTSNVTDEPTDLKSGRGCLVKSDCYEDEFCADTPGIVNTLTSMFNHQNENSRLVVKANIRGKECSTTPNNYMKRINKGNVLRLWNESVEEIRAILGASKMSDYGIDMPSIIDVQFTDITEPVLRTTAVDQNNQFLPLFLILALRGDSGTDDRTNLLVLLSLFQQQQFGGTGSINTLSNPFLLYSLLGSGSTGSSDILLYSFLMNPTGITTTPGQAGDLPVGSNSFFSNPLILYSLLNNEGSDNNLLLLLFMSGGLGGTTGGVGGGVGGINQLLPLLLLSNSSSLGGGDLSSILPLLLLSGGGLGGIGGDPSGGGINSLIPLLLLDSDILGGSSNDNILPLLLLSSGGLGGTGTGAGTGLESILPLLLLSNSSLGGGSGGIDSLLPLLLLSGGGLTGGLPGGVPGQGGINSLLPLLLLSENGLGGGDNNILLLSLLSQGATGGITGGGSGIESILPLLLLSNSSLGGSGDLNDILPLLLLSGGGLGGGTIDPSTGLPVQSPITQLLPLLLLRQNSGTTDNTLLLFILMFSQQSFPTPVSNLYG
uniref:Uncharacterized protein LOC100183754 n=1 Tax=Phallusia mammillata TaxID=59560 RepID=A0A6F9DIG5_9ASCI|nr:uncharacterized protein LOC100183754 [Phallusia mammillata]